METHTTNIFIVDDNNLVLTSLKQSLEDKFQSSIQVSTFIDGESCLEKVNQVTHIVILDYFLDGENGLEILKKIKEKNPETEVIMFSSNEDVLLAIETFREGAKDYVIKGEGSLQRLSKIIQHIILAPVRLLVKEFGVSKYMAIFLLTFISMGLVVACTMFFV